MLPQVCPVTDRRWRQYVTKNRKVASKNSDDCVMNFLQHFYVFCDLLLYRPMDGNIESILFYKMRR